MIPAWNVIYAHVQDFVAQDELLLPVLKAFAQYICSLYASWNVRCSHSVWWQYCSVAHADSSPLLPPAVNSHLHHTRHACLLQGSSPGLPSIDAVYVKSVSIPTLQMQGHLMKLLDVSCLACTIILEWDFKVPVAMCIYIEVFRIWQC